MATFSISSHDMPAATCMPSCPPGATAEIWGGMSAASSTFDRVVTIMDSRQFRSSRTLPGHG